MAKAAKKIVFSRSRGIPFSKLVLSASNVRRIRPDQNIDELAEDIARREEGRCQSRQYFSRASRASNKSTTLQAVLQERTRLTLARQRRASEADNSKAGLSAI
jgi:hypothetical protein